MTELEQFEAWAARHKTMDGYPEYTASDACQTSRRAALEEAAKVCDEIASDCWNLYKGRAPYTGREPGRADPHVQGESDGADKCAAAIRASGERRDRD